MKLINRFRYAYEKRFAEELYWKRRNYVQAHSVSGGGLSAIRLVLLRHTEAKFCSTTGLSIKNPCCQIASPLILPHGLSGIIIAHNVKIGKMCRYISMLQLLRRIKTRQP